MKKFKIIIKEDCGFCTKAITELVLRKHDVQVIDVTNDHNLREAHSLKNNNWPTVPMISCYNDDGEERFIGGYTDLMNELENQEEK
jgi:glutaredoxin-related protein